jgi:hypothetical protein
LDELLPQNQLQPDQQEQEKAALKAFSPPRSAIRGNEPFIPEHTPRRRVNGIVQKNWKEIYNEILRNGPCNHGCREVRGETFHKFFVTWTREVFVNTPIEKVFRKPHKEFHVLWATMNGSCVQPSKFDGGGTVAGNIQDISLTACRALENVFGDP